MAVTPEQIRRFVERKERRRQGELERLHGEACRAAARIVQTIVQRYRPARIVQWGSLLDVRRFRDYSDIDLAVEGVTDPERFFSLLQEAEAETGFPLDIVQLERVEPEFRDLILQKGRVVYERERPAQSAAE